MFNQDGGSKVERSIQPKAIDSKKPIVKPDVKIGRQNSNTLKSQGEMLAPPSRKRDLKAA